MNRLPADAMPQTNSTVSKTAPAKVSGRRKLPRALLAVLLLAAAPTTVWSQGFQWPWEEDDGPPPPPPPEREPTYRPPPMEVPPPQGAQPGAPPPPQQQGTGAWATSNPICLQLEQRLVQEGQRGDASRSVLPQLESEMRQLDQAVRQSGDQLERRCYEYFLFSKSLRNTPQCRDLARQNDADRRRLAELTTQRQSIMGSGGRSYQDDIISELARNNCGASYQQQARRRENTGPFGFWEDDSEGGAGGGGLGTYGNLGYATYRTLCVRLCDGYYFPVSFSTLPNHFPRDQEACQSRCAAPTELYYYQNPGGAVDQMVSVNSSEPYSKLPVAFRYRKEYVKGCSCKMAEYVAPGDAAPQSTPGRPMGPPAPPAQQQGQADPGQQTGSVAPAAEPPTSDSGWGAESAPQ
jgi:hypothetical protein